MNPHPLQTSEPPEGELSQLLRIMARLRSPEGCPWDREQTHETLKPFLLEEAYEVLEALDSQDPAAVRDELGDLLLQIIFHAQISSENGQFSFSEICRALAQKLVRRHPHVFQTEASADTMSTSSDVIQQWERLKDREKESTGGRQSHLDGVPKTSPALDRAYRIQKKASRAGFDWPRMKPVLDKFHEEVHELSLAVSEMVQVADQPSSQWPAGRDQVEAELGDVLFSVVNLSRFLQVHPEEALRKATNRFIERFIYVENQAKKLGKPLPDCSVEDLDRWWNSAKDLTRKSPSSLAAQPRREGPRE